MSSHCAACAVRAVSARGYGGLAWSLRRMAKHLREKAARLDLLAAREEEAEQAHLCQPLPGMAIEESDMHHYGWRKGDDGKWYRL